MKYAYMLGGGAPIVRKYKIGETMSTAGVPVTNSVANGAGLALATTTAATDAIGVTTDTGTYSTTQGDAEGLVSVIINPDVVWQLLMANSATAGTQLVITTNTAADTGGTVVTKTGASGAGDPDPNSPQMDEGTMACIQGPNVGQTRKITSTTATTATVTVPYLRDLVSGDIFLIVPWTPADVAGNNIQLTSNLTQARQDIAVGTGAAMRIVELEFDFSSVTNARRNSFVYATLDDHWLNVTT